jgi:nitric oxide reductase NorQ protein
MNPTPPPTTSGATPGTTSPGTGPVGGRRAGHLYRQVALHLASRPDTLLKVGEVTTAIGAPSAGAVFEALKKMTTAGYATHHTRPHRFQITQAGIDAAGAMPPPAPRTPTGTARRASRRQPVPRPNGELYFPRRLAGATDIDVLRRLRDKHIPVLLYGPPGTGKTALVEAAFPDVLTIAGTGDTMVDDFCGSFIPLPANGGYEFVYGPLVVAMREGRPLLVDDATLIPPKVLAVLYPAMDGRGVITLPAYRNEHVHAVDGFYVIAGHNPGVHGAILTDALASRFEVHIEVTTDWDLARHLGVPTPAINAAIALNQDLTAGKLSWAPQLRDMLGFARVRKTLGLAAAVANLAGRAPEDDRPDVITALAAQFGGDVTTLTLGKQR